MGLFGSGGLKSAASSIAQIISSLIGQDIVAKSISLSQAAGNVAVQLVTGARLKIGGGTTDYITSDGTTGLVAAGAFTATNGLTGKATANSDQLQLTDTTNNQTFQHILNNTTYSIYNNSGQMLLQLNSTGLIGACIGTPAASPTLASLGGILNVQSTPASNINTGETDLFTYSLPANTMTVTNRGISVSCYGSNLGSATTKTLKFYFGTAIQTVTLPITNAGDWELTATIVRTGLNTQRFAVRLAVENDAAATVASFNVTQGTAAQTETAGITIKVTGQDSVGSGAVTANLWGVTAL